MQCLLYNFIFACVSILHFIQVYIYISQAEYLQPHLHGVIAYLNFVLLRVDSSESSDKGKLVSL